MRFEDARHNIQRFPIGLATPCIKIPVVVHVVYAGDEWFGGLEGWIGVEQVLSQLRVLNEDFRMRNADLRTANVTDADGAYIGTPAVFLEHAADALIQFELVTVDPEGAESDGIDYVNSEALHPEPFTSLDLAHEDEVIVPDYHMIMIAGQGGADAWPGCLNIWTGNYVGYALGAYPGTDPAYDGVIIPGTSFGTVGSALGRLGRTCTHEVGHWLNLRHLWGDENFDDVPPVPCTLAVDPAGTTSDDLVDDTPVQRGANRGSPTFPNVSCNESGPNGDMFVNFMDYTADDVTVMFTAGQVARMRAAAEARGIGVPCAELSEGATSFVDDGFRMGADAVPLPGAGRP